MADIISIRFIIILDILYSKLSSLIEKTAANAIKEIAEGHESTKQDEREATRLE